MSVSVVVSRRLFAALALLLVACASARSGTGSALIPKVPRDVLEMARTELRALGYAINDSNQPMFTLPGDSLAGGELRGERPVGLDMDTRGQLFEVITVSAQYDLPNRQTRMEVRGGMESLTTFGWQRVPSTRAVRDQAEELLRKLSGKN